MKIICIGRNYREHIVELDKNEDTPKEPQFFLKPETALLRNNTPFYVPNFSNEVHYELEIVVRINRVVKSIEERFAHRCYDEVGLGIDFTARDIQRDCIEKGLPWEIAKAFDHSAAISKEFVSLESLGGDIQNLKFDLLLNNDLRQQGNTADMIFSVDQIISHISNFITLKIGDLIFTGTPAGVGKVVPGDRIVATLQGETMMDFAIK